MMNPYLLLALTYSSNMNDVFTCFLHECPKFVSMKQYIFRMYVLDARNKQFLQKYAF